MGEPSELPDVGSWAREKLDRLRKYLAAYTTILKEQSHWCKGYVYVDAFAGAGRAVVRGIGPTDAPLFELEVADDGDRREVIDGSPAVALAITHPFTAHVFVERDPERLAALRRLEAEYGSSRRVRIHEGDCNQYLLDHLIHGPVDWTVWRAVVFLDPFGMQVPWSTLEALGRTRGIEVFVNFPVGMAIQRLLKRSGQFTEAERAKLDAYFGDPGWFDAVYLTTPGLFGPDEVRKADDAAERLVEWYRGRLRSAFGHVSVPYLVRNSHGGHLYYLLFAGPNRTGAKIASDVLEGGERVRRKR
jgi:three-Cys-motif partner protein